MRFPALHPSPDAGARGHRLRVVPLVDQLTLRWFVRDLDIRADLVANSMQEPLQEQLRSASR